MIAAGETPEYIARLNARRAKEKAEKDALVAAAASKDTSVDDLLADASENESKAKGRKQDDDITKEATKDAKSLNIKAGLYTTSEWRMQLAELVTSPRNRWFAKNLVNRAWAELIGRGIVDPIDDFSDNNPPSHPSQSQRR